MKTDLLKPTKAQIKNRNRLWAEALRKNNKKAKECMYDGNGGRCCLAVAQDVATEKGVKIPEDYEVDEGEPHSYVSDFFGWNTTNPTLVIPREGSFLDQECAVTLNDDWDNGTPTRGMSHKRIAECVENTFVHPSKKKWSFTVK
jgi:hypothetical protein